MNDFKIDAMHFRRSVTEPNGENEIAYYRIDAAEFLKGYYDEWNGYIPREKVARYKQLHDMALKRVGKEVKAVIEIFYDPNLTREEKQEAIEKNDKEWGYTSVQKSYDVLRKGTWRMSEILKEIDIHRDLREYYFFDIHYFLKDALSWEAKIVDTRAEIENEIGIKAVNFDGTGGGKKTYHISNPVTDDVVRISEKEVTLNKYETYAGVLHDAINSIEHPRDGRLTALWREVLKIMFIPTTSQMHLYKAKRIEIVARNHAVSITKTEQSLFSAKTYLEKYIEEKYWHLRSVRVDKNIKKNRG